MYMCVHIYFFKYHINAKLVCEKYNLSSMTEICAIIKERKDIYPVGEYISGM